MPADVVVLACSGSRTWLMVRRMRVRFGSVVSWLWLVEIVPSDMVPGYVKLMRPIGHMRPADGSELGHEHHGS